jgi:aminoglycoside phosphotransferase (APT) family kinase protein
MLDAAATDRLEAWLAGAFGAPVTVRDMERLSGGAIQDNRVLRLEIAGRPREVVLRRDAAATIEASHDRMAEFALLRAAHAAGVTVPEPLALCEDASVAGAPFAVMARVAGTALGPKVVRDARLGGDRPALVRRLGHELARIHAIRPPRSDLGFLGAPPAPDRFAQDDIAWMRAALDRLGARRPALEWGLRWAERHAPPARAITLIHRDFRTGNIMMDERGLTGILDWEFATWGDPACDLGWFCARCWRFGRPDLEAGGLGERADLEAGYVAGGGEAIDAGAVRFWEVMAHLRWAVIALQQGERHRSGREPSLEHALTGRIAAELEHQVLAMTEPSRWQGAAPGMPQPEHRP